MKNIHTSRVRAALRKDSGVVAARLKAVSRQIEKIENRAKEILNKLQTLENTFEAFARERSRGPEKKVGFLARLKDRWRRREL
jgi:DNA anti-recombination protein RmuC